MIVDLVRSCYRTKMSFFPSRPDLLTTVQWYFCRPGALPLPFPTRFNSSNWTEQKQYWPGTGEVLGQPRPWSRGQPPASYLGNQFAGTEEQFRNGCEYPVSPVLERLNNSLPVILKPMPGGFFINGLAGYSKAKSSTILADGEYAPRPFDRIPAAAGDRAQQLAQALVVGEAQHRLFVGQRR